MTVDGSKPAHVTGFNFIFERMSPADVWDLIATAARVRLFRVPVRQLKRSRKL